MFNGNSPAFLYEPALATRVLRLIIGRLAFVVVIVLGGWWWVSDRTGISLDPRSNWASLFLPVVAVLTVCYLIWLRFGRTLLWQIRAQFLIDTILITWVVWKTGDIISPYVSLYIFMIGLAGFFLGKMDALAIAGASAVCFAGLPLLASQSLIYSLSGDVAPSRAVQTIAFNDAAFLLVGLLAARLAERRKIGDELKLSEANFANLSVLHERILASIKSGLITTDLNGKIYAFNRAAEEITGIDPNNVLGRSIFLIFGDEIRPPIELCLSGTQTAEFLPPTFEAGLRTPQNGAGQNVMSCTVVPLVSGAGGVTGLIMAFQDTTHLRLMEEAMRRSDRLAAVGRLAAGLAHEIRNPLGSMSSALQFLATKPERDDALMDVVLRESERLNAIITDFLAYARPGPADEAAPEASQMDVAEAIGDCMALLRHDPAVNDTHIFEFEPPGKKVMMRADEAVIKQIFWNLAQNSIQSMPKGGRLSVGLHESAPDLVRVVVGDTGTGIGPENIDKIFEPFHSGGHGTGLGLSIVHRIVTECGGRIEVDSELGSGTRITVDLPTNVN